MNNNLFICVNASANFCSCSRHVFFDVSSNFLEKIQTIEHAGMTLVMAAILEE